MPNPTEARYHVPQDKHPPYRVAPRTLSRYAQELISKFTVPNKQTQYNPMSKEILWEDTF